MFGSGWLSDIAISLEGVNKSYMIYDSPVDRLKSIMPWNKNKRVGREHRALKNISLEIAKGEVVGIVGRNGAGKSTLLQIVCKILEPSSGRVEVNGRVAALLELGSGFNPEFSGRENVYLAAAIAGMDRAQIESKYDEIVEFSEIGEFIEQPVKTYSSGMMVRLAFSVATSVEPDILVIDEALSVGDGAFARKSFDRIMKLKDSGCTILFCSHSLHQVETFCNRAVWIDAGEVRSSGIAGVVITEYMQELNKSVKQGVGGEPQVKKEGLLCAKIKSVRFWCDNEPCEEIKIVSGETDLKIAVEFSSDPNLPSPNIAITFDTADFRMATSATSYGEKEIARDSEGNGRAEVLFEKVPLLRGRYFVSIYLMCEKCIHFYDSLPHQYEMIVEQKSFEKGIFRIEHKWFV